MNITEQLEFLTQIHTSWNNTEQRIALRKYPRRHISYEYIGLESWQSQYLRALVYNRQTEQIEIPLWHAGAALPAATSPGQASVPLSIDKLWHYRGCQGLILWTSDQHGGDRYAVQALYGDGSVKLNEQIQIVYPQQSTTVCPVTYGILQQEDKYEVYSSVSSSMQINVEVMSNYPLTPLPTALDEFHYEPYETKNPWQNALPASYLGVEVFRIAPAWSGDFTANFSRNANKLDNQSGIAKYDLKSTDASENKEIEYIAISRPEMNNLQRFFCRCKGRLKSFYAPTWLSDMVLVADAEKGQNFLLVNWPLFWKYYSSIKRRKNIIVFLKNNTTLLLSIAGFTTDDTGTYGKVFLDSPLQTSLRKEAVAMISFLCRYRFDSDIMTTSYETVDVASTSFIFAEVNA